MRSSKQAAYEKHTPSVGYCRRLLNKLRHAYTEPSAQDIVEPFVFVHFVYGDFAFRQIQSSGLMGRSPETVSEHRLGSEPDTLVPNGYIFAYRLPGKSTEDGILYLESEFNSYLESLYEDPEQWDDPPRVVILSRAVFGISYAGLEVFRDHESQIIIPVECIDSDSLEFVEYEDVEYPFIHDSSDE